MERGITLKMAEEEGFEPPDEFPRQRFSRPPVSTTHPFLRVLSYLIPITYSACHYDIFVLLCFLGTIVTILSLLLSSATARAFASWLLCA
jgi:hypothetical protein